jgi:GTP-sensing pleiotropic transcriptional regulator CodY
MFMNFKSLKVLLISSMVVSMSSLTLADAKAEKIKVEKELNTVFQESLKAAASELDADKTVSPFAVVLRKNGKVGYFTATEENKELSVNEQGKRIRRMLKDLAINQQIDASAYGMYATVSQNDVSQKGLVFEVEHKSGISIMRFLPVSDGAGDNKGKLVLETQNMQTVTKPRNIFVESIVKSK